MMLWPQEYDERDEFLRSVPPSGRPIYVAPSPGRQPATNLLAELLDVLPPRALAEQNEAANCPGAARRSGTRDRGRPHDWDAALSRLWDRRPDKS
jgi:hypothetical protein